LVEKLGVLRLHVDESFDLEERVKNNANYLEERDGDTISGEKDNSALSSSAAGTSSSSSAAVHLMNTAAVYLFREDSAVQEQTVRDVKVLVRTIMGGMKVCCQAIQNLDQTARVTLSHPVPVMSPDRALLHTISQMAVVKDHVACLSRLFRYSVECGGYFLTDRVDRFQDPQDRNTDPDVPHVFSSNNLSRQHAQEVETTNQRAERKGDERARPSGSISLEITDHISSIAGPFSLLDTKMLSQVLHSVMSSFIGSAPVAPRENYFFTAVIEMLLTSAIPSVNYVCLQAVLNIVSIRIGGSSSSTSWSDVDGFSKKPCALECKSALCTVFTSALRSLQRYPDNESALAAKLTLIVSDILKVSNLLPFKSLARSNCLHFLRLIFKTLQSTQLRMSLLVFKGLFSTTLHSLEGLLNRVLPADTALKCEILGLICTLPLDVESLTNHSAAMLGHILSSLRLTGHDKEIGDLYRLALTLLENCVDILSLGVLSKVLSTCTATAEGLFSEISRHLQPKPYPLGELSFRLMGKLGCCFAFFRASHTHNIRVAGENYALHPKGHGDSLVVQAGTCLLPLEDDVVVCDSITLHMDFMVVQACKVFECDVILPPFIKAGRTRQIVDHTDPHSVRTGSLKGAKSGVRPDTLGDVCAGVDPFITFMDTVALQTENTVILDAARVQHRMDALVVLEGSVACMLAPYRECLQSHANQMEVSSPAAYNGSSAERAKSLPSRQLLSRVLSAVYSASSDNRFESKAIAVIQSVFAFASSSRESCTPCTGTDLTASRVLYSVVDALYDVILQPIHSFGVVPGCSVDTKVLASSKLLRAWLSAIAIPSTAGQGGGREGMPRHRETHMFVIPPKDPLLSHLVHRCLLGFASLSWGYRVSSAHILFDLCELLPAKTLSPYLDGIVEGVLLALEYPFCMMGLCGVECFLRTLRAVINSCLVSPRSSGGTPRDVASSGAPGTAVSDDNAAANTDSLENADSTSANKRKLEKSRVNGTSVSENLLSKLVHGVLHPSPTVGLAARCALGEISKKVMRAKGESVSVSAVLSPLKDLINSEINERLASFASGAHNIDQGYLSGLTYCCNLSPPLVVVNSRIMDLFTSALHATEDEVIPLPLTPFMGGASHKDPLEDDLLLSLQNHPYPVHPAVLRRLRFVRLTHALCTAASASSDVADAVLNESNRDTLQKTFGLLFKSLGSAWDDIGGWSQRTLHLLIGLKATPFVTPEVYESIFPR
jgi:hypothetical protein